MAQIALVWPAEGAWAVHDLAADSTTVVGRADDADLSLSDPTVSRHHIRISCVAGRCSVENLSTTNRARRNGERVDGSVTLADRDRIALGEVTLTFTDLAAGDGLSAIACSNCGRENESVAADCWFCGTSLVNAASSTRTRKEVAVRVFPEGGAPRDLYRREVVTLSPDGTIAAGGAPGAAGPGLVIRAGATAPTVSVVAPGNATINGAPLADGTTLRTGDVVRLGEACFTLVVR